MEKEDKDKVALFRYGVISDFINGETFIKGGKEKLLTEKSGQKWIIPFSNRTSIGKSTIKEWIKRYRDSGNKLEALCTKERNDHGKIRTVDSETIAGLINLRKEMPEKPLLIVLKEARRRGIIQQGTFIRRATAYRIFQTHAEELKNSSIDRRKFEAEEVNVLWQSDVMHGPRVKVDNKARKSYLIAIIDDHSRYIIQAKFCLYERLDEYLEVFKKSLLQRGIPKKLYVDNGPAFRSNQLEYICASLGIALIHAKPYQPEGKGKIERWFRTVRMSFLSDLKKCIYTLDELNKELEKWLEIYQNKVHLSIKEKPSQRFMKGIEQVRSAPNNLEDYFRKLARRTVRNDRTITFKGKLYETPVEVIGKQVKLLYWENDSERIELLYKNKTYGFLKLVDANVNYRISREQKGRTELITNEKEAKYSGGSLFEKFDSAEGKEGGKDELL